MPVQRRGGAAKAALGVCGRVFCLPVGLLSTVGITAAMTRFPAAGGPFVWIADCGARRTQGSPGDVGLKSSVKSIPEYVIAFCQRPGRFASGMENSGHSESPKRKGMTLIYLLVCT